MNSSRRRFIHLASHGAVVIATLSALPSGLARDTRDRWRGLKLGVASYSFREFSLDQAIAMTSELGLRYICLKSFHLDFDSPVEQLRGARRKIVSAGLILAGGGVIEFSAEPEAVERIFTYAKAAGMPTLVCSPVPQALDIIEEMAIRYDIRIALHNHGPDDPIYPLPTDALKAVEGRDARMGVCMDVGHTVRAGGDAVAEIRRCGHRLYDFHLKDVSHAAPHGRNMVLGQGIIDLPAVLRTLLEVRFTGHLAFEYEATPKDPLPGMKASLDYLRYVFDRLT